MHVLADLSDKQAAKLLSKNFWKVKKQVFLLCAMVKQQYCLAQRRITNASGMVTRGQILAGWALIPLPR